MKTTTLLVAGLLVVLAAGAGQAQQPKYGVTTKADEKTDFSKLKTYVWEPGWKAYDKDVHQQITTAVERELAALGFTKGTAGKSDVTVVYATVRRTDVDLKSKEKSPEGLSPTIPVGTLVVLMKDPKSQKELFRARTDTPLDAKQVAAIIDKQVAEMFAQYPTRRK